MWSEEEGGEGNGERATSGVCAFGFVWFASVVS